MAALRNSLARRRAANAPSASSLGLAPDRAEGEEEAVLRSAA